MNFIELTNDNDAPVLINLNEVKAIHPYETGSMIEFAAYRLSDIIVKESYYLIKEIINWRQKNA